MFVEQVNTVKVIRDTMGELCNRQDSIKKLSLLCQSDSHRFNVKETVIVNIKELESYLDNLPTLLKQT